MKILKLDPNDRLPLSEMLSHRFITKYFPNAAQSLIKPDNNSKAKTFIVSKDDPNTWDPYQTDNPQNEQKINKQRSRGQSPKERGKSPKRVPTDSRSPRNDKEKKPENVAKDRVTVEKYKNLKEKYENLLKDYN